LLVKIIPNYVVSFEVRTTISCNSRLVSNNFSCANSDHLLNSIGITLIGIIVASKNEKRRKLYSFRLFNSLNIHSFEKIHALWFLDNCYSKQFPISCSLRVSMFPINNPIVATSTLKVSLKLIR